MATWRQFVTAEPEMAREVAAAFAVRKHCTLATVRADGAPRISGTEVTFTEDDVLLGMMPDSRKGQDVRADPRIAVHSPTVDPESPVSWVGEAKFSGHAVRTSAPANPRDAQPQDGQPQDGQPQDGQPQDAQAHDHAHADTDADGQWYRVDLTSVVFTDLTGDPAMLRIRLWRPGDDLQTMTRT